MTIEDFIKAEKHNLDAFVKDESVNELDLEYGEWIEQYDAWVEENVIESGSEESDLEDE